MMKISRQLVPLTLLAIAAHLSALAAETGIDQQKAVLLEKEKPAGQMVAPEQRRVFFGELHLHTTFSLDAWGYGTKLRPDAAYRFGQGEPVKVPAAQLAREHGITDKDYVFAQRSWPLDFMAVTDHSENLGTMVPLENPDSEFAKSELGQKYMANPGSAMMDKVMAMLSGTEPPPELHDAGAMKEAWEITKKAANDYYQPGKFTTFIAYEWSALPKGNNLHRNVIFNADHAPDPFTAYDSTRPEDLWTYLDSVRAQGIDVLAIPHNSNVSNGLMFDWNDSDGKPIDEAYAQRRAMNEPLAEIVQIKGQSETIPELSPNDEFANFEIFDDLLPMPGVRSKPEGSYVRDGLGRGVVIDTRAGSNPFKYGMVGASDIHNSLSVSDEANYAGDQFGLDADTMMPKGKALKKSLGVKNVIEPRPGESKKSYDARRTGALGRGSAGLTGVWAEENTRDSIFSAFKRRETFATSGTRIRLRMFASWDIKPTDIGSYDWLADAYARGTAMGGDLPGSPGGANAPYFIVEALKDPDGANLDRIQIIKLWADGNEYREKIFNVALSDNRSPDRKTGKVAPVGSTINLKTGNYTNEIGAPYLSVTWQDPEFEADSAAVYYARVLEIPTPRWSTLVAVKNKMPIPDDVPATIQERAWSSPIWFKP